MVRKKHHLINLMPESYRQPSLMSWDHLAVAALILVVIVGGMVYYRGASKIHKLKLSIEQIQAQQTAHNRKIEILKAALSAGAAKKKRQGLVEKVIGQQLPWAEVFKELGMVIPPETWLTEFTAQNIDGRLALALNGETTSQSFMADFYASLERSEYFKDVLMISSKLVGQTRPSLYRFEFASPSLERKKTSGGNHAKR